MATEISALIAVLAAVLSALQLLLMRTTLRGTILTEAAQIFWNRENREDRLALAALEQKPFDEWSDVEIETAGRVQIQISQIALLLRHSYADRRAFLDYWASWCVRYYVVLVPLIAHERAERPGTDTGLYFEWLAREAMLHMRKRQWWEKPKYLRLKNATRDLPDAAPISPSPI
jgi:hypothetical protein